MGTYSQVPVDTDILVTHSPPYGILDQASDSDRHEGCHQFLAAVQRIKPMLQVFGYVHGACGTLSVADTLFVNAALPGHGFGMSNPRTCSSCRGAKVLSLRHLPGEVEDGRWLRCVPGWPGKLPSR